MWAIGQSPLSLELRNGHLFESKQLLAAQMLTITGTQNGHLFKYKQLFGAQTHPLGRLIGLRSVTSKAMQGVRFWKTSRRD